MPTPKTPLPFTSAFTQTDVVTAGLTRAVLRGWRERGEVIAIAPGVFVPADMKDLDAVRALLPTRKVADGHAPVPVVGAAQLHGLWTPPKPHRSLARSSKIQIPHQYLTDHDGLLVPSLAWTAVNIARWQGLPGALVAFDSALRLGESREALAELADQVLYWPGARDVRIAVDLADPASESALESWSRALMIKAKLPAPMLQHRLRFKGTSYFADFCWPDEGLIGEADGLSKYDGNASIASEKHRQEALQALGFRVFRWTWRSVYPDPRSWTSALRHQLDGSPLRWRHQAP